jgi:hypothetical protein
MFALLRFFLALFSSLFKSKSRLEAENAALRRQVIVLQRKVRGRVHFTNSDRLFQSRASKFQTNYDVNGDRFLCAVGCAIAANVAELPELLRKA